MQATSRAHEVPFFDYTRSFKDEEQDLVAIFRETGRRGAFILQRDLAGFEQNLARFAGARFAAGVGNATDGLIIALRAAGLQSGEEAIFCSHTMVATAAAIHFAGGVPIPVECGADHLIDPKAVEASITPRTRVILPTQLNGRTADMNALEALARRHGLLIIEDAAQALGSRYRGRAAGTFGGAGVISFYPAKLLGCLGDGGAVLSNDDSIHEQILLLRDHGRAPNGEAVAWGLNSRLDNLQAAILDHRLGSYSRAIERRRTIAGLYRQALSDIEEIVLPPGPDGEPDRFDVYQNYEIEARDRDALREYLKSHGVGTLIPWGGKAVHQWKRLGLSASLPATEKLFQRVLMLPMNTALSDSDASYVSATIRKFYCS